MGRTFPTLLTIAVVSLTGLYNRFLDKPLAIAERGVEGRDDSAFVNRLFDWVRSHPRSKLRAGIASR